MHKESTYQMYTENNKLIFRTSSYRAEKTSVLHAGVYTKEFSSMLFASAAGVLAWLAINNLNKELKSAGYFLTFTLFIAVFLGSRKYIFKDNYLNVTFNRENRTIHIVRPALIGSKTEVLQFEKIRSVEIGSREFLPENIDGIDFVQKISAQHGSAVPELSEPEEFITLSLMLTDGSARVIYAAKVNGGKINGEPEIPVREIRQFLGFN